MPSAHAADTLASAIALHNSGVSDEVLIAWAEKQPPVPKTAENLAALKTANLSKPVIDALLLGNTRAKAAAAPAPKPAVPAAPPPAAAADNTDIRLAPAADDTQPPLIVSGFTPTAVIDGWNVYNYDPFHTYLYGWPRVYSIFPYVPNSTYPYFGYGFGTDWRHRHHDWDGDGGAFRWQNQITPAVQNPAAGNALPIHPHPPHWPHAPAQSGWAVQTPQSQPVHVRPREEPAANVTTHVTESGVKYVTQSPQQAAIPQVHESAPQTPHYYVPPAASSEQPTPSAARSAPAWSGGFRR